LVALSVKVSVAVSAAAILGVNVILAVQDEWAATLDPQVVADRAKSLAFVPEMTMLVIETPALVLFVNVIVFAALVLFKPWLPKAKVAADSVTCATPVPVRAADWGLLPVLSVTIRVAVSAISVDGVNVTLLVQEV
jgi:uncharacterized membrane protein (DUF485 family)